MLQSSSGTATGYQTDNSHLSSADIMKNQPRGACKVVIDFKSNVI